MTGKILRIGGLLMVLAVPAAAWASPRTAICVASSWVGEAISEDGSVRAVESVTRAGATDTELNGYVAAGRSRIEETLWSIRSAPEILFLDGEKVFGLFDYNRHGSAVALPGKTCLLIGPEGTNVDVVAHEMVHADLAGLLGYRRTLGVPAWIHEGIAMQVDWRERYGARVLDGIDPRDVMSRRGGDFYVGEVDGVVRNYASARHLFDEWIAAHGVDRLLSNLRSGDLDVFRFP